MIRYQLKCGNGCEFEGWFRSSDDFDAQAAKGMLECPSCGSAKIGRAVMAPAVVRGGKKRKSEPAEADMRRVMNEAARRARDYVEKNFDYVGERFPEEARRIHYGETADRSIWGEASGKAVKELIEEGVTVAPVPGAGPSAPPKKKLN
jgi:hypothetical protein